MDIAKFVEKVQNVIFKPEETFKNLSEEKEEFLELFVSYFLPLAGLSVIGYFISGMRFSASHGVAFLILYAIFYSANYFVSSYVSQFLSKNFGGSPELESSAKLIAYSSTPSLFAGFFVFIPILGGLISLAGLVYSVYLFYLGAIEFLKIPKEKVIGFIVVFVIVELIALGIVYTIISAIILGAIGTGYIARRGFF